MTHRGLRRHVVVAAALALGLGLGCGGEGAPGAVDTLADTPEDALQPGDADALPELGPAPPGTRAAFALDSPLVGREGFFDLPWPSDMRLTAQGSPDFSGLPNPQELDLFENLRAVAMRLGGFPTTAVAWLRFDAALAPRAADTLIPADVASPLLLLDTDPDSPERGRLFPLVAMTLEPDAYVPDHLLALAPRPGHVLVGGRTYAFVVRRALADGTGLPLGVPEALHLLAHGRTPSGAAGAAAAALYAPLWETLDGLGVPSDEVAAATVFTTASVVADLSALGERVRAAWQPRLQDLAPDPDDGLDHERFCELQATITLPQFQVGKAPFDVDGLFEPPGADGLPPRQRDEVVPVTLTVPRAPMPQAGYPLVLYHHGSGGLSSQVVDRGPVTEPGGPQAKGKGPAHVVAAHGLGAAGYALPINPQRSPGAHSTAYINIANLAAYTDTVRQGSLDGRLVLDALLALEIPPETLAGCDGATLPEGARAFRYDPASVLAMGQSQGGFYSVMFAAVEPRVRGLVPTGTGGFWSEFILVTDQLDAVGLIGALLGTEATLTPFHPTMHLFQTAWEPVETMPYMQAVGRRPLPGHPVRDVYQPVGKGDRFYPTTLFDALALAFDHQQAGELVWPSMQEALATAGTAGLLLYPVTANRLSADGTPFTGVVVQYEGDGLDDPHAIFVQRDEVKYQYGCFFRSLLDDGRATVPAPRPLGTPCGGPP